MATQSSQQDTPLVIKQLCHHTYLTSDTHQTTKHQAHEDGVGHYQVLHKHIDPTPLQKHNTWNGKIHSAEIETRLEQFVDGKDGTVLWRRVVVASGPSSTSGASAPVDSSTHATFLLPDDAAMKGISAPAGFYSNPNLVCWTSFPDRPDHNVLCVLAHPTLLCIWDVYPMQNNGEDDDVKEQTLGTVNSQTKPTIQSNGSAGQSHQIPLPFEACGIHAVVCKKGNDGLLLQRCETTEDFFAYEERARQSVRAPEMDETGNAADDVTDDGFDLKPPPKPVRLGGRDSTDASKSYRNTMCTTTATSAGANDHDMVASAVLSVPSLFSLSHPLGDVLPLILSEKNVEDDATRNDSPAHKHSGPVTDVFEKILFVGTADWVDPTIDSQFERQMQSQVICVTYHTLLKRHAVWEIHETPTPPPPEPLWKICQEWRSSNNLWDSHLGVLQQDLEDMELMDGSSEKTNGANGSSSAADLSYESRANALADALGVMQRRTTPRNAAAGVTDFSSRRVSRSGHGTGNKAVSKLASLNHSLLSPISRPAEAYNSVSNIETMSASSATGNAAGQLEHSLLSKASSFAASLQPKMSTICIYRDPSPTAAAEDIFLASNAAGSGLLSLCLLCSVLRSAEVNSINPKELRVFSLLSDEDDFERYGCRLSVRYDGSIPCVTAQPIDATPLPKTYVCNKLSTTSTGMAKDILLLQRDERKTSLYLYRHIHSVVNCAVEEGHFDNDVSQIIDLQHYIGNTVDIYYRDIAKRQLGVVRGRLSLVLESSMLGEKLLQACEAALGEAGLGDVALKLRVDCVRMETEMTTNGTSESLCNEAVKFVILSVFRMELLPPDMDYINGRKEIDERGNWDKLLKTVYEEPLGDFRDFKSPVLGLTVDNSTTPWADAQTDPTLTPCLLSIQQLRSLGIPATQVLFDALHLLYEDMKLRSSMRGCGVCWIGSILSSVCEMALCNSAIFADVPRNYLSHYARDLHSAPAPLGFDNQESGAFQLSRKVSYPQVSLSSLQTPPCILGWIEQCLSGNAVSNQYAGKTDASKVNAACERTITVLRIFSFVRKGKLFKCHTADQSLDTDFEIAKLLVQEGFVDTAAVHDEFTAGLALPLLEALHRCRSKQIDSGLNADAQVWSLIGRNDLYYNLDVSQNILQWMPRVFGKRPSTTHNEGSFAIESREKDGVSQLESSSSMLFPADNRLREVCRLLRSSRPIYLRVPRAIEFTDHDYERKKQEKLLLLSRRVLALPIGRGMLTVGNLKPVPAEPLSLPDICLSARVPPTNATLALDTSECPADMKVWPEFHNGVAAGLRLPMQCERGDSVSKITRTWIVYNRSSSNRPLHSHANDNSGGVVQSLDHGHGGLLMALGMRGYLSALEMTDVFDYLTHGTITTTVGTLLGMAANMRGTCDISVSKMLCLHIPSLIPQHFSTIDVASTVQAAAVTGAGLVYEGSCHRMMTEFLLDEIGKRPSTDGNVVDREAYSLACGIALGMVNLCKGDHDRETRAGLADLRVEERLYQYIVGGPNDFEMRHRRNETDRLNIPSPASSTNNERCSCIYEGGSINIDVTSPGATLALGLMYMKSGNRTIASAISIPDTHFLLEYVRPDFLMLRIISRALILWDDVQPTSEWIDSQIPKAILDAYSEMRDKAESSPRYLDGISSNDVEYDRQAVRLNYTHLIAGACFAIGLRFAGTGDMNAASAIFDRLFELHELRDAGSTAASALRPPLPVLEMCLGCAALSLSMVLAGTGDLDTFRLLKVLRWPCTDDITYGSHLAYATAIGLLFLGGGTCTLGRDPKDIASLVVSFYPRYPQSTSDNQYHLQALRNLYALASKTREIRAIDVDTGESVFVPVEVHFENKSKMPTRLSTPCVLLNTEEKIKELRVVARNYFPLTIAFNGKSEGKLFFVKRKSAYLCHENDRNSEMTLVARTIDFRTRVNLECVCMLTGDKRVLQFAEHLCSICDSKKKWNLSAKWSLTQFCVRVLHEAFLLDTQDVIPLYLALWNSISFIMAGTSALSVPWDFRLIAAFFQQQPAGCVWSKTISRLLNPEVFAYLVQRMEVVLESLSMQEFRESDEMDLS